ncbi:MAG TPA: ABC transporter ATP-binding protein [Lachnospiraceae bacterium]|jgi:ABC-2 type transport system ATP-binding protein|nr:ABC transporter ATP-binding protein [Lachnospiraceae bacterium]
MAENIIITKNLVKQYGEVTAVDHLNLSIRKGEVFGLLGPNGAGKTTTTLMLLGLTQPTSGRAFIDGIDCSRNPVGVKKIVGYLPDNVGFYPDMTGFENLVFTGEMNGLGRKEAKDLADSLLDRVGMTFAADRKTSGYSRGMRQRLGIANVLMKDPEIIIMDEPTLGIDPEGMRELTELIKTLSTKDGRTVLLSSHELYQVQQICDRVGIFVKGKLIACGAIDDLGRQLQESGLYILSLQIDGSEDDKKIVCDRIRAIDGANVVELTADGVIRVESSRDLRREIFAMLVMNNITLLDMHQSGGQLEEIYRKYFEKAGEEGERADKKQNG